MKPVIISGEDGVWFDEESSTPYQGKMQHKETCLFLTKKNTFVLRRRDGYHEVQSNRQALDFLKLNSHELDQKLSAVLYPKDKEI